jgi:hypothetical protein
VTSLTIFSASSKLTLAITNPKITEDTKTKDENAMHQKICFSID